MKKIYSLLLIFSSIKFLAQPGTPDPTFNGNGKFSYDFGNQDNLQCVAVQPNDQKIVTAGTSLTAAFAGRLIVMRHLTDGTLDESFSNDGIIMIENYTESYAYACHVGTDGKITIAGAAADPTYQFSSIVLRFHEDGTPDETFGDNGVARHELSPLDDFAYNMAVQSDGKIIIAGTATNDSYLNIPTVVRLLDNGELDPDFGNNGIAQVEVLEADNKFYDVKIDSQNRIVACGHVGLPLTSTGQFNFDVMVARFLSDGSIDQSFGTDGMTIIPVSEEYVETGFGLSIGNQDQIIVAGYTTLPDFSFDALLIQLDSDGNLDSGFSGDGIQTFQFAVQDVFYDVTLDENDNILAGGTSGGFFMDDRDFLLMRVLDDGTPDNGFAGDGSSMESVFSGFDEANAIALQEDGKMILAGKTFSGTNNDVAVIRYLNSGTIGIEKVSSNTFNLSPNPACAGSTINLFGLSHHEVSKIMLYNSMGKIVIQESNAFNFTQFELPSNLSEGKYEFRAILKDGNEIHQSLIIMKH
ncbi:MAG: hypothetical protein K1X54_02625 [Flavobacteriales bacterium]|nr:hypothetical protein [Flavobacteriales bacterium]